MMLSVSVPFDEIAFFHDVISVVRLSHLAYYIDCVMLHVRHLMFKFLNYTMGKKYNNPLDNWNTDYLSLMKLMLSVTR